MMQSRCLTSRLGWAPAALLAALAVCVLLAVDARPADDADDRIELLFLYGSEKKEWLNDATKAFHASEPTVEGKRVHVTAIPMGSGETIRELLDGDMKAHLISPASGAYLELGNSWARDKKESPLVGDKRHNLVLSPVVVAMWEPMARALGWPDKPIGWADLRTLAQNGWGAVGHPNWGAFKFGHTHPESSNSGLITLLCEVYAATGKKKLSVDDVESTETAAFLKDLESSVVHYGESTGFFADKMFDKSGRSFLSAAVLYENLVIESYTKPETRAKLAGADKVVAIYPKEGTFLSDHPVAVVERPWVTPLHRKAAEQYIAFLLQEEQQKKALKYGFRPGEAGSVEIGAPIDKEHGADPSKPGANLLRPPDAKVMKACLETWQKYKKRARIVLVIDRSYKMSFNSMLFKVRDGAEELIDSLGPGDWISIVAFGDDIEWLERGVEIRDGADKKALKEKLEGLDPKGKRKLFDAIAEAHQHLQRNKKAGTTPGVVVLAINEPDRGSSLSRDELLRKIRLGDDLRNDIRVCTFAYVTANEASDLKDIADATRGAKVTVKREATPETVRKVLRALATFF